MLIGCLSRASTFLAIAFLAATQGLKAEASPTPTTPNGDARPSASASSPQSSAQATSSASSAWVLGIARFSLEKAGDPPMLLQDTLPLLIAADIKSLPIRRTPDEYALELNYIRGLRAHFAIGADLAAKLDTRALRFFDPILDAAAWKDGMSAADKQLSTALMKLEEAGPIAEPSNPGPAEERVAELWDGYSKGLLIETPTTGLSQAAKAANVDLLVTGNIALQSGYANVQVYGFDASLERQVFVWKSHCSIDDPSPLAAEIARRIERWTAGKDFARITLALSPPSAELRVNGDPVEPGSSVIYSYSPETVHISASSAGFSPFSANIDLLLGDDKTIEIRLDPIITGEVALSSEPSGAAISLDSVPMGRTPMQIELDGSRRVVLASENGMEAQTTVLPATGDSEITLNLIPADGLGPKGRIVAAKDKFYSALGVFILSLPVTAITYGISNSYSEAYPRSIPSGASSGDANLFTASEASSAALWAAVAATGVSATFMVLRLIKYIASAH